MIQKLIRVGSSAAVTIPKKSLSELGLKIGDKVALSVDKVTKKVVIEASFVPDKELLDWSAKFIKRYRPALDALAKK